MATLTNPITPQNIVDRFADYVATTANASIVWGTNANPTMDTSPVSGVTAVVEVIPDSVMGGSTSGKTIGITGTNLGAAGDTITASTIYNTLVAETNVYTRIKNMRARGRVTGGGGNTGTRLRNTSNTGVAYRELLNTVNKTHMSTSYVSSIGSPANGGVASGQTISSSNLETFFTTLRTSYTTKRDATTEYITSVCHASCHSSCHGSRGRR